MQENHLMVIWVYKKWYLNRHYKVVYTCKNKICGELMYIYTGYPHGPCLPSLNKYKSSCEMHAFNSVTLWSQQAYKNKKF